MEMLPLISRVERRHDDRFVSKPEGFAVFGFKEPASTG